jgi:Fungal chitosanase of glycosyl hydrolase group 75
VLRPNGLILICAAAVALLTGCPNVPPRDKPGTPTPAPSPTPEPRPTPLPTPYVPAKRLEVGRIFNGMQYRVNLETDHGTTATKDRNDPASYAAEVTIKVKVPKPQKELADIAELNPKLPELFPALTQMMEKAEVSPFFDNLYRLKVANLQSNLNRLDVLLSRHNFYDCETILEIQHPETKRRALFVQADMDVDEDGSDSDRVPVVDGSSLTFQPFTSYRWPKKTDKPNPFIVTRNQAIEKAKQELAKSGVTADRKKVLNETIKDAEAEIADMKKHSYLVGAVDPFIVMPRSVVAQNSKFSIGTGDYCAVIHGTTIFPAIVGDVGPTYKMGEASMRICKEISARSSSINRPVSDLKITYLVFPGTADKPFAVPDLAKWREQCVKLIGEIGGTTGEVFTWVDLTAPPPPPPPPPPPTATPAPTTTPAPGTPAPAAPPAPGATPSPGPTAAPTTPSPAR